MFPNVRTIQQPPSHSNRISPTEADAERIERIAAAFVFALIAEQKYVNAVRQLPGMDKFEAVDAVVARLIALQPPNIDRVEIRARVWRDLMWHDDLRNIPAKGTA